MQSDHSPFNNRVALVAGFGSILVIMTLAGLDALRVLSDVRQKDDRIRRQFLSQNHVLNDIRSQVYLSGTFIRDYLLEPDAERADKSRISLEQLRRQMKLALDSYRRQIEPTQLVHYSALESELSEYWRILAPVLGWGPAERQRLGYAFLRDEVYPRRQNMLGVADKIASINEQQLNAGNEQVVSLLGSFQTRLAVTLFAALFIGLGMAVLSIRRIVRLEDRARMRFQEVAEARTQMKELSARLVQAQETERRALSRELHDEVGQSLSAALVELRNLSTGLQLRSEDHATTHVEAIKNLVEGTIRAVRNMALLLRPSMLDDLGLVPALKWQAREISKRTCMEVSVAAELTDDLPDDFKTCIYRVVQEALHNCAAHSGARTVRIRVRQDSGLLNLSIQDDGQGFDARQVKGLGLLGMQERVAQLGGKCMVHSEQGAGTILSVELPIRRDTEPQNEKQRETDSHLVS
ncbi:MAG TPA: ATP-binding protein [Bryobacteraceae bacterium]|nr:ATP-binding protein [Bryobacteraceae bacterium]